MPLALLSTKDHFFTQSLSSENTYLSIRPYPPSILSVQDENIGILGIHNTPLLCDRLRTIFCQILSLREYIYLSIRPYPPSIISIQDENIGILGIGILGIHNIPLLCYRLRTIFPAQSFSSEITYISIRPYPPSILSIQDENIASESTLI